MTKQLNMLLYYHPVTLYEINNYNSLMIIKDHFKYWLIEPMQNKNKNICIKTILPEITYIKNTQNNLLDCLNPVPFYNSEIKNIFGEHTPFSEIRANIFKNNLSKAELENFKMLILKKIGNFIPDIIIVYPEGKNIFQYIFPNTLILEAENSIFSRPPFPRTLQYDPVGLINSFHNKFKDDMENFSITKEQNDKIEDLKQRIIELTDKYKSYSKEVQKYREEFKYLILVPLTSLTNVYKEETIFCSDFDYLTHIMENVPSDIGVIVTQHDFGKGLLNDEMLNYFSTKYKNLIFFKNVNNLLYGSSSLNFFSEVDAIIVSVTMTGLNSLFWDKKIISLAKTFNNWFCDKHDLTNLKTFLSEPIRNKNNILYWYLTHYPLFEKRCLDGQWLYNYFVNKLEKFRKDGITFDYYNQIENIDELSEYIIEYIENFFEQQRLSSKPIALKNKRSLIQKIFSVYSEDKHKILSILGFKMKFKRFVN